MATEEDKIKNREAYRRRMSRKNRNTILICLAIFFLLIFSRWIWGPIGVNILYGQGERIGKVIKISNRGLIWKSWEYEAVLSQQGFAVTYIWPFSVDNDDPNKEELLRKVRLAFETGETVKIKYNQMAGVVPWRSKTPYFIKEIRFPKQE